MYKDFLTPMWAFGLQLWGSAKKSNLIKIQVFQKLRKITNALSYISNIMPHNDLNIKTVHEEAVSLLIQIMYVIKTKKKMKIHRNYSSIR